MTSLTENVPSNNVTKPILTKKGQSIKTALRELLFLLSIKSVSLSIFLSQTNNTVNANF